MYELRSSNIRSKAYFKTWRELVRSIQKFTVKKGYNIISFLNDSEEFDIFYNNKKIGNSKILLLSIFASKKPISKITRKYFDENFSNYICFLKYQKLVEL